MEIVCGQSCKVCKQLSHLVCVSVSVCVFVARAMLTRDVCKHRELATVLPLIERRYVAVCEYECDIHVCVYVCMYVCIYACACSV